MNEMNSLTLNDKTYDCFVDGVARPLAKASAVVSSASGESIVVSDSSDLPLVGLNIYGKTTQAGTPTIDAPVDLVSVGAGGNIDVNVFGKNLLQNTAATHTVSGVTFTVKDGSVIVDGTVTDEFAQVEIGTMYCRANTPYVLSGCPSGGGRSTYWLLLKSGKAFDYGASTVFSYDEDTLTIVYLRLQRGVVASGLTFRPMIRLASIASNTFESYSHHSLSVCTTDGLPGVPVSFGGNYTDASGQRWCADEIDLARGMRVQRVCENASLTFGGSGTASGNVYVYSAYLYGTENVMNTRVISTHFNWVESGALAYMSSGTMFVRNTDSSPVVYCASTISTVDGFNAWIRENNVRFLSILATPIEIPLTEEEIASYKASHTNKPNTTIFNDSGAYMSLKYNADPKSYIDNKVSGILAATVE